MTIVRIMTKSCFFVSRLPKSSLRLCCKNLDSTSHEHTIWMTFSICYCRTTTPYRNFGAGFPGWRNSQWIIVIRVFMPTGERHSRHFASLGASDGKSVYGSVSAFHLRSIPEKASTTLTYE